MAKYPIYLDLSDKRIVIIGSSQTVNKYAVSMVKTGGRIVIITEEITPSIKILSDREDIELVVSAYSKEYLSEAFLVIAAQRSRSLNLRIYADCKKMGIPCSVMDEPEFSDFTIPTEFQSGDLSISVSTKGDCKAFEGHIRRKLEVMFDEIHCRFLSELEIARKHFITEIPRENDRNSVLGHLCGEASFEYFRNKGPAEWRSRTKSLFGYKTRKRRAANNSSKK